MLLKDGKRFLKVTLQKSWKKPEAKDGVAVDANMAEVVVGKDDRYFRVPIRQDHAHYYKSLAEDLQKEDEKR
ncbi:hypothetical protein GWK48_07810 [Metallosphaera tengchongensis]|uniref:Uncharacterized protein n=1 Tax=Metallosphaera tengchongensis TaxID=1532350 RepID=A0A6N0NU95_9CREN|nr:hypothetical protein [Metallosphaera tengchongensis]QKR00292.1 hypothetical protein GWK48_07810 [Metallosphaera tengchongensis]